MRDLQPPIHPVNLIEYHFKAIQTSARVFFFRIFEINCFCFAVAIFDLVHAAEAIFHIL